MISDLVFDFFGTLVLYKAGHFQGDQFTRSFNMLSSAGISIQYKEFETKFSAAFEELESNSKQTLREFHMDDVARLFFQNINLPLPAYSILKPFVEQYISEWNEHVLPVPGLLPLLNTLAAKYRLSILSNTHYPDLIHRNLKNMQIESFFAEVVTSVEFGLRKPAPQVFRHTLNRLSIPADHAVYIGDSFADDFLGAVSVPMRCILIDPEDEHQNAPERIKHLDELTLFF